MAAASIGVAVAVGQTPAPPNTDWNAAAIQSQKQNAQILAQFDSAMSVEPAFSFKA